MRHTHESLPEQPDAESSEHKTEAEAEQRARPSFPMAHAPFMMHGHGEGDPGNDIQEWTVEGAGDGEPLDPNLAKDKIIAALKTVYDPEIPVNIYDLGLIYGLEISESGEVEVKMTLTAPGCPVAGVLVKEVAEKASSAPGVTRAHVALTWDPPWNMDMMTEEARLELGLL